MASNFSGRAYQIWAHISSIKAFFACMMLSAGVMFGTL